MTANEREKFGIASASEPRLTATNRIQNATLRVMPDSFPRTARGAARPPRRRRSGATGGEPDGAE
jgi:hypothetical protein